MPPPGPPSLRPSVADPDRRLHHIRRGGRSDNRRRVDAAVNVTWRVAFVDGPWDGKGGRYFGLERAPRAVQVELELVSRCRGSWPSGRGDASTAPGGAGGRTRPS